MFAAPDLPPDREFVCALTKHQTALRGFCQAALGREDDAMEALQRTNLVLWKKAASWDPKTSFLRWHAAVARFEVLALIRDRQRLAARRVFDSELAELMAEEGLDDVETFESRQRALALCWAELLPKHREVLVSPPVSVKNSHRRWADERRHPERLEDPGGELAAGEPRRDTFRGSPASPR